MNKKNILFFCCVFIQYSSLVWADVYNPFQPKLPKRVQTKDSMPKSVPKKVYHRPTVVPVVPQKKRPPHVSKPSFKQKHKRIIRKPIRHIQKPSFKKEPSFPKFNISGIVWNCDRPQAIINGTVVDVGDTLDSLKIKVTGISKDGVEVMFKGVKMTVAP